MKSFESIILLTLTFPRLIQSQSSVSCATVPTVGTLDSVPYSTGITTITTDGNTEVGVIEYYRSITYISSCGIDSSSTSEVGTTTVPVF